MDVGYAGDGKIAFGQGLEPCAHIRDVQNVAQPQVEPAEQACPGNGSENGPEPAHNNHGQKHNGHEEGEDLGFDEPEHKGKKTAGNAGVKGIDDLEYDDVMEMDRDDMEAIIDEADLDIPDVEDLEDEEMAAEICAELGLKKPRRRNSSVRSRLSEMNKD